MLMFVAVITQLGLSYSYQHSLLAYALLISITIITLFVFANSRMDIRILNASIN
jgi:hypothetical protein